MDSDPSATSRLELAGDTSWILVHLAIAIGVILVAGAFTALRAVFTQPVAATYARFGAATALIGGTMLVIVFGGLDGYASHSLASQWETTSGAGRDMVESAAIALDAADSGITSLGIVAMFGVTMGAFGRAILAGRIVTPWLGWAALAIGVAGVCTGVVFALEGPTSFTINVLFRPLGLGATVYFVVLAVFLRRLASGDRVTLASTGQ